MPLPGAGSTAVTITPQRTGAPKLDAYCSRWLTTSARFMNPSGSSPR